MSEADDYNYSEFRLGESEQRDFTDFKELLHVGDPAPDGEVVDAETGEASPLSALWRTGAVVLEFGSST